MEPAYYRIVVSKATFVEGWRATRNLFEFFLFCVIKVFRLSFLATYAITNEGFKRLEWNDLPEDVQAALQPIRSEFETCGFRYCFCYCFPTLGTMQATEMVLLSDDGNSCVSVKHERHQSGSAMTSVATTTVVSELSNGTFLATCDRQDVLPPEFMGERHPHYSIVRLAQRHRERIAEASPAYPLSIRDDYDLQRRVLDIEERIFRLYLDRGMLAPLSAADVERYRARGESTTGTSPTPEIPNTNDSPPPVLADVTDPPAQIGSEVTDETELSESRYPGVIAELEKIRNKKGSWLSGAVLLGVSVLLFLGAGAARWDWHFAVLLIPILLFHEFGHFAAMRVFKYRNLKMFFIPLLGAAVTGQNYNVAGWKKAIVSLAGPVPGIFVGTLLGIVALLLGDQPLLLEAAALTVFLNAFNLLPFLPLDGGWIVHVLLFSRHHVLDTVFRFLAATVLILWGIMGIWILLFIGIMMLLGLRSAARVARVASDIRDAGIDTSSPDGQRIPIATADAIISRLDAAAPLPVPDAIKAQQTLQVFESVNARPPGVLGTLALFGVYAGSFVFAAIAAIALIVVQQPDFMEMMQGGMAAPRYRYECGTGRQWPPAADRLPPGTASTVVATFASIDKALATFEEVTADLADRAIVTHFGQSVLVTFAAESPQIDVFAARFESALAAVKIASPEEPILLTLDTELLTPELAGSLEEEVNAYFSLPPEMALIPPWDADREVTREQHAARNTYHELTKFDPYEHQQYAEVAARLRESIQQQDQASKAKAVQEQRAVVRRLQQEYSERLLARDDLDKRVIELYSRQPEMPDWNQFAPEAIQVEDDLGANEINEMEVPGNGDAARLAAQAAWLAELRAWHLEMGSFMGQLPLDGEYPIPSANGISGSGSVERTGLTLRFWITFNQPDDGALAFANWLCSHDCTGVKYGFSYE